MSQGELFSTRDPRVLAFFGFHDRNPHLWPMFQQFADHAAKRRKHFSARDVLHAIRWWTLVETDDPEFKINNNWSPFYGRMYAHLHPALAASGFFEFRESVADRLTDADLDRLCRGEMPA